MININGSVIKSSNSEKSLGITIDSDFTFEEHINTYQIKIKKTTTKGQELLQSGTFFYEKVGQALLQSWGVLQCGTTFITKWDWYDSAG